MSTERELLVQLHEALMHQEEYPTGKLCEQVVMFLSAPEPADNRTMGDLAREIIGAQDACNLSGLVLGWGRSVRRLRVLLSEQGIHDTTLINNHPINKLWAEKLYNLSGCESRWMSNPKYGQKGETEHIKIESYDIWKEAYSQCLKMAISGRYGIKAGDPDAPPPSGEWEIVVSKGEYVNAYGNLTPDEVDARTFKTEEEAKEYMQKWFHGEKSKEIKAACVVRFN